MKTSKKTKKKKLLQYYLVQKIGSKVKYFQIPTFYVAFKHFVNPLLS